MKNFTKKLLSTVLLSAFVLSSTVSAQAAIKERSNASSEVNSIDNAFTPFAGESTLSKSDSTEVNAIEKDLTSKINSTSQNSQRSGTIDIGMYESWAFTGVSQTEIVCLQMDIDTISLVGYCEGNVVDNLTCYIWAYDNSGFELNIPFYADGDVTSYAYYMPAGEYKVKFTGTSTIRKTDALCVFSRGY